MADINLSYSELTAGSENPPDVIGDSTLETTQPKVGNPALVTEVRNNFQKWRADRRPHEGQWFFNAALIRGFSRTRWNPVLNVLERKAPSHRSNEPVNIILPKVRAKIAKLLKDRAYPVVTAASTEHEDILNAKGTEKVLSYQWLRCSVEEKYEESLFATMQTGKSFLAVRWNTTAIAQIKTPGGFLQKPSVEDVPLGDVEVELVSAFEILVADAGISRLRDQEKFQRVKVRPVGDVEQMFGLKPGTITGDTKESELFQYQRQIAMLGAKGGVGNTRTSDNPDEPNTHVAVIEQFSKPCSKYPKGQYVVVAGDQLLHESEELPYDLATATNPYPFVEFFDIFTAGQFWPTTMVEQLAAGQTRFTRYNNQVDEHLKLQTNPRQFIPKQAGIPEGALNSESGNRIPFNWQPNMPPPDQWVQRPPAINGDVWRAMDGVLAQNDMISNLFPAALGGEGATSGFDTNLLQEAADSVFAPDIRRNELALRDLAYLIRRLVKLGYDIPRLITIVGRDNQPEVFEFSSDQIDEHANIHIEAGSALPTMKASRIQAILELDKAQMFGQPGDPSRTRKMLRMLDLGSSDQLNELTQRDENHARLENLSFSRNEPVEDPMPWENHDIEYEIHTDLLKSQEIKSWPPEQRSALVRHVILHVKWKNPMNALQLASVFGMQDVIAEIQQTMMVEQQAQLLAPQPGMPPPQGGVPQGGAPQGAPPSPPLQGGPVQ